MKAAGRQAGRQTDVLLRSERKRKYGGRGRKEDSLSPAPPPHVYVYVFVFVYVYDTHSTHLLMQRQDQYVAGDFKGKGVQKGGFFRMSEI